MSLLSALGSVPMASVAPQMALFHTHDNALPEGFCWLPQFLPPAKADHAFSALKTELNWQAQTLHLYGREVMQPRLVAWYGDPQARYTYSGRTQTPQPWTTTLSALRTTIEHFQHTRFNSVLANRYRDGRDSMAWHSDNEPELGAQPVIASLSLGATRAFHLRHRTTRQSVRLLLAHGDLLIMQGDSQRDWQHCIPKTARPVGERVNLTFRWVHPSPSP